jgi:hypothetical protein
MAIEKAHVDCEPDFLRQRRMQRRYQVKLDLLAKQKQMKETADKRGKRATTYQN